MYFMLFIVILAVVYIKSFKDSFNQEQLQKVGNILTIVTVALIVIFILASILLH